MDKLLKYNGVQEALKFLCEDDERTLKEHLEMCQIPAPSYEEGEKAEYVRKKMVDAVCFVILVIILVGQGSCLSHFFSPYLGYI